MSCRVLLNRFIVVPHRAEIVAHSSLIVSSLIVTICIAAGVLVCLPCLIQRYFNVVIPKYSNTFLLFVLIGLYFTNFLLNWFSLSSHLHAIQWYTPFSYLLYLQSSVFMHRSCCKLAYIKAAPFVLSCTKPFSVVRRTLALHLIMANAFAI